MSESNPDVSPADELRIALGITGEEPKLEDQPVSNDDTEGQDD